MTDFTLRPWREADAASIARYADNAKIAANLRDVFPCPYATGCGHVCGELHPAGGPGSDVPGH